MTPDLSDVHSNYLIAELIRRGYTSGAKPMELPKPKHVATQTPKPAVVPAIKPTPKPVPKSVSSPAAAPQPAKKPGGIGAPVKRSK